MSGSGVSSFPRRLLILKAVAAAVAVTLLLAWAAARTPLIASFEHWTSDWRIALFADRMPEQHPRVAVVVIDEASIAGLPYRSPIDRAYLAQLLRTIDNAGPSVIALDFIIDQPTEPEKDAALWDALKSVNARLVIGALDERTAPSGERIAFNRNVISDTRARPGLLNMRVELDGTVRRLPSPSSDGTPYFGEAAAEAAGAVIPQDMSRRIAWLRHPPDADAFLRIPAAQLLEQDGQASDLRARLLRLLRGKVVLVGADLTDSPDKFFTPLSKLDNQPEAGVMVHAQATAQYLDGRSYAELTPALSLALAGAAAFAGFLLGWRYHSSSVLVGLPPLVIFALADVLLFTAFNLILPFGLPVAAWVAGVFLGRFGRWFTERQARAGAGSGVEI